MSYVYLRANPFIQWVILKPQLIHKRVILSAGSSPIDLCITKLMILTLFGQDGLTKLNVTIVPDMFATMGGST